MAHYFLRISPGELDDAVDACDLPSLGAAKAEALRLAGEILAHGDVFAWSEDVTISLTDDHGLTIAQIHIFGTEAPIFAAGRSGA